MTYQLGYQEISLNFNYGWMKETNHVSLTNYYRSQCPNHKDEKKLPVLLRGQLSTLKPAHDFIG